MAHRTTVTLTQLRYFVESAEQLSMTRAAQLLHVAQSAVSTAIGQLEAQVGAQLFVRRRASGLLLTTAGKQLLRDARNLLAGLDEALDAARGHGSEIRGSIRIACFVTLAPFVIPSLLAELGNKYPDLTVEVVEADAAAIEDTVRSGDAELAIAYDFAYSADIDCERVATSTPYVLLPKGHRLASKPRIKLAQLADEPMILLDLPRSREYFVTMLSDAGVEPVVRYRSDSYEAVRTLVARGHGFSILNQRPASTLTYDGSEVAELDIADGAQPLPIVLVTLNSVQATARARAVAAEIRRHFAAL